MHVALAIIKIQLVDNKKFLFNPNSIHSLVFSNDSPN